jgi:lysozyme family protein
MPRVALTDALKQEFTDLYTGCEVLANKTGAVDQIVDSILANKNRYQQAARTVAAPWYFVAAIHNMESSLRFDGHLHNGDPLSARTVHVPAGRPATGSPPFTWEESAADALALRRINGVSEWNLPRLLYELEGYNGWGYRLYHPHVKSPYLWSFSNRYTSGKYVADGSWSDTAVSKQCGAAVIVRRLEERGEIDKLTGEDPRGPVLRHSNARIDRGEDLQRFLNTFPGVALRVDGKPGDKTSDACMRIFGHYLHGDPRGA